MPGPTYSFDRFQLDTASRRLTSGGDAVSITVKAFDILAALVENAGRVVDKDELMRRVWPDAIVEEANLSQQIFLLRKALGEGPKDHQFIATVPRRGYRFVAVVTSPREPEPAGPGLVPSLVEASAPVLKLSLSLAPGPALRLAPSRPFAISPDGRTLAYVAEDGASGVLAIRRLDRSDVTQLARTEGASSPFFSPDSRWIGYFANGRLWRVPVSGGGPVDICEAGSECRGASWSCLNEIVFAPSPASGLMRVPVEGGRPRPATDLDFASGERTHRWPEVLPGGRSVLFTIARAGAASFEEAEIAIASLETGERRILHRYGSSARYAPTGHLAYVRGGSLMAVPFDLARLEVTGSSMPVAEDVMTQPTGAGYFSASEDGTLVCLTGRAQEVTQRLIWVAGDGLTTTGINERAIEEPRVSPDGRRIAFGIRRATSDIWIHEIGQGGRTRLTFDGDNFAPIWSRDGHSVTFSSNRNGPCQILTQALDAAEPTLVVGGDHDLVPGCWSSDGKQLLFTEYNPETGAGIWICTPHELSSPQPLVRARGNAFAPALSPDNRVFAYASDETGRLEVWVASLQDPARRRQISADGGAEPMWSRDGRRLHYRAGSGVHAIDIDTAELAPVGDVVSVADGPYQPGAVTGLPNYDVAPDSRLLLVAQSSAASHPDHLSVTVRWHADIVQRLA